MRAWQALLRAQAAGTAARQHLAQLQQASALRCLPRPHARASIQSGWPVGSTYTSCSQPPNGQQRAQGSTCHGRQGSAHGQARCFSNQDADDNNSSSNSSGSASSSASGSSEQRMLLREFIQQSLYHPEQGYFSKPRPPVSRLPNPINFRSVVGQAEYGLLLDRLYKQLGVDWLTPVEIFRPWYGRILARYMVEFRQHSLGAKQTLAIVEIGGGTGTLAASILDHVRERAPEVYGSMSYTTIEISAPLAQLQQQTVAEEAGHSAVFSVVRGDAASAVTWRAVQGQQQRQRQQKQQGRQGKQKEQQHCFVLAMEVLDNLPHDRVVRAGPGQPWQQSLVVCPSGATAPHAAVSGATRPVWHEELEPLNDPVIARCVEAVLGDGGSDGSSGSSGRPSWLAKLLDFATGGAVQARASTVFLPTGCLALLDAVHTARPNHTFIAADFDALPDIAIPGTNAPLVSSRDLNTNAPTDHKTLLVPWGSADIFFPTDFAALAALYGASAQHVHLQRQKQLQMEVAVGSAAGVSGMDDVAASDDSSSLGSSSVGSGDTSIISSTDGNSSSSDAANEGTSGSSTSSGDSSRRDNSSTSSKGSTQESTRLSASPKAAAPQAAPPVTAMHMPTSEFLCGFPESKATRTLSGWNPLLQDWPNTQIFLGSNGAAATAAMAAAAAAAGKGPGRGRRR